MSATEELEEATATWELDEAGEKGARHAVPQFGPHLPQSPPPCSLAGNAFTEPPVDLLFRAQTHTPSITLKNESNLVSNVTYLVLGWFFYGTDGVRDTSRYGLEKLLTRPKEPIEVRPFGANWEPTKEQILWVGFEPSLSSVGRGTPTSTASQADGRGRAASPRRERDPPSRRLAVAACRCRVDRERAVARLKGAPPHPLSSCRPLSLPSLPAWRPP